ncbi:DUF5313 family protein [Blastococcus sp. VKM Ac-2987]|uniref:DUF5313 family protein n=1 Tax=Blastococcus sp. VKM Ac-2987 TaxID=3004141 RepID=UPI0022AB7E7D|nr:DUF5313 family protein [Blastococcus sp. VKM Ac-2987]MCZ2858156.1 DUF5313 family protein [Blastococcus sp. VKM Ac-2987]
MAHPAGPGPTEPVVRPAPHRWVWYALGGGLPERHRAWVLHDTTTDTWWMRHVARMLVQLAVPIALVVTLLPAPLALRLAVAGGGIFLGLIFSLAYMPETTENRVVKAGYPAGTATAVRDRAGLGRQQRETERKRAAAARRAARYRGRTGR